MKEVVIEEAAPVVEAPATVIVEQVKEAPQAEPVKEVPAQPIVQTPPPTPTSEPIKEEKTEEEPAPQKSSLLAKLITLSIVGSVLAAIGYEISRPKK